MNINFNRLIEFKPTLNKAYDTIIDCPQILRCHDYLLTNLLCQSPCLQHLWLAQFPLTHLEYLFI